MLASTSLWAVSLALLQFTEALGGARSREFSLMADMGLNPDGTPMSISAELLSSLKIGTTTDSVQVAAEPEVIAPEYVELPLDHFAKNGDYSYDGTFYNRFWVAERAYKPGGPVFIYDIGEANAEPYALSRLQNETSFFKQIVDKYNGVGIVWEHRYYGNSTPEPIDLDTPPEVFKWLNTEQSLADVDRFAKQFKRKNINATLTPDKTPWIFIGGSYPGMRAVFMRDKYPDTIFASYASSAPTQAQIDMSIYYEPVYSGMNKYGFGNCTKDIHAAITYIDKLMERPSAAAKLKEKFLGLGAANNSHANFADALTIIFYAWQSYGVDGPEYNLRSFCDWIETDPATNKTAPAQGWAAKKGAAYTVARWASWPKFVRGVNKYLSTNCSGSQTVMGNCDLGLRLEDPASIAWTWQYCTQWGYFQSANIGPRQMVSKHNSLQHQRDICHRQFPTAEAPLLPDWPRTDRTNNMFGGWDLRPSQVYWSGGEFDPWRTLSPLSGALNGSPHPQTFTQPPQCGEGQSDGEIFGYVMPDAQHCYDFRPDFKSGEDSRKYFTDALTEWLGCFKQKGGYYRRIIA
ncbi:peptidase S28 [Pleomassaria siparia CBS 279.74]|uniref:Peptidase S28 n=1 Tax=Pleomassaria siparia CBS 279.74 TaxID=1314801 RepID=A0A6G1K5C2_9PLEO|nr:peptidase S28 [Pleomassaria siparia CBS 279.74]